MVPLVVRARQRAPPPVKLLLVNPSRFYSDAWVYGELHHLFALFSYVRNRCPEVDVDVLDLEKELFTPADDDQVEEFLALARAALATRDFDVVGISCWSSLHYLASLEVARLCRELHPECTIVVGGYHPSALPGDFAFEGTPFDYVVVGEGERALERILRGEVLRLERPQRVQGTPVELGAEPLRWNEYRYFANTNSVGVWLTRGCPFACGYCLDRLTKWRGYDPQKAVDELARVKRLLPHLAQVNLLDPIFGLNVNWRRAFLDALERADLDLEFWGETRVDLLEERDVERLGRLRFHLDIGLDAPTPAMAAVMMKTRNPERYFADFARTDEWMSRHRLPHFVYLILNYPGETPGSLDEAVRFWTRYYDERRGGFGTLSPQPFKFFPGNEVYDRFGDYEARFGARVLHPRWWTLRRPNLMDLAGQIVPSREMLESGKLAHWASVKDQLVQVSRAHVDGTVARRLLKWSFLPELQVVDSRSFARSRPLKLHDDALYQRYPDGRGFLFNFSSRWAYLCTPSESGWLEQALGGDARPPSEPVDEARRDDFLRKLLVGRFLDVALAPPPAALPLDRSYSARIETRAGTLEFALLPEEAPRAVANFVHLARAGWYDGLAIERSHPGAYLVAGAVLSTGAPAYVLPAERTARRTRRGSLWMSIARDATRFTVCRAPWPPLDDRGAVIGELAGDDGALDRLTRGDAIVRVVIVERPLDPPS